MPGVSPDGGARHAKAVADLYGQAVADLITLVSRRLAAGITEPGWAETKLTELLRLRADASRVVRGLQDNMPGAVAEALGDAYASGAGRSPVQGGLVATNRGAIEALAAETTRALTSTHTRILRAVEDMYRQVIADTVGSSVTGTATRRQAAARALDRYATHGVTGYLDAAGRTWRLESYTEMATRTATGQAHVQGGLDRFAAQGRDLVIVSDAPEECDLCRPYEGAVLSTTGRRPTDNELAGGHRYAGTLAAARGAGFMHPNCRHTITAFIPGLTKRFTVTADPVGDALRQRQRALERAVRESKRRVAAVEPIGDPEATRRAKALLRDRQARLRVFVDEHGRKRLRHRERLGAL